MNDPSLTHCSHAGCAATIPSHRWARIKSEWFVQKDGTAFCPDHVPDWVDAWRDKKRQQGKA